MTTMPDLKTSLLDLLHALAGTDVKLIIGGGFGVFLKVEKVRKEELPTLLPEWPEPRVTNDIDLFLRPELLINSPKLIPLVGALKTLGYKAIPGAENYQFSKLVSPENKDKGIKIDLLTGPQDRFKGTSVKADDRRARPSPSIGLHAHPVDEVATLEEGLLALVVSGTLSSGRKWEGEVHLPHPYSFLLMKLFALKDRLEDQDKEFGRYHALDLYSIIATMTEKEWTEALGFRDKYQKEPCIQKAAVIVGELFSGIDAMGIIRLRESRYFRSSLNTQRFMDALREIFPAKE